MKTTHLFLFALLLPVFANGQPKALRVLDSLNRTPVQGAQLSTKEGKQWLTDKNGYAAVSITGTTKVVASYPSYTSLVKELTTNQRDTVIFLLQQKSEVLEAANISVLRQQVKTDAKSSILDLSLSKNAPYWKLKDALEQIPGVRVSDEGVVSYMGEAVSFKENGFASAMLTPENLKAILQQPAASYKQVELIFYDTKSLGMGYGSRPVIDLSKPKEDSFWGMLSPYLSMGGPSLSATAGWQRGIHRLEARAGYSYNDSPDVNSTGRTEIPAQQIVQNGNSTSGSLTQATTFGVRYNLDLPKHVFDLSVSAMPWQSSNITSFNNTTEYHADTLYRSQTNTNKNFNSNTTMNAVFGYIYRMSKQSKLYFTLRSDLSRLEPETSLNSAVQGVPLELPNYSKDKKSDNANIFTSLSYEYKHAKAGAFDVGISYFSRNTWETLRFRPEDGNGNVISELQVNYDNFYDYGAIYGAWARTLGKTSFNLVLKGDYSSSYLQSTGYSNERFTYFSFAPYLSLSRMFGKQSLRLSVEYFEKRPSLYQLNPTIEPGQQGSIQLVTRGNPNLKPPQNIQALATYSFPLLKKVDANLSLRYVNTNDDIQEYRTIEQDTIIVRTFANLSSSNTGSGSLSLRWPATKKLTLNASANSSLQNFKNSDTNESRNAVSWGSGLSFQYLIGASWSTSLSCQYYKTENYQSKQQGVWSAGINVSYNNKALMVSLGLYNLNQPKAKSSSLTEANGYISSSSMEMWSPNLFSLSLNYRFGTQKNVKQSAKAIKVDDM